MAVSKLVVVVGATGSQGGSVIRSLLANTNFKIRGITRNNSSSKSQELLAQGVEMVEADINNYSSLVKAFEGAHAIFAVTDFVELSMSHSSPTSAQEKEYLLGKTLADAAESIPTLAHYIWSTLPSVKTLSEGRYNVFHFQGKAAVDEYIIQDLPNLTEKTTFLWVGYYANSFAYPPLIPSLDTTSGKYVWKLPISPQTLISSIGSPADNVGVFVAAILDRPALTLPAKYVFAVTEKTTQGGMLKKWSNVMGLETEYIRISMEEFERLYPGWVGFMEMFQFWEEFGEKSWSKEGITPVGGAELGVRNSQLVDIEGTVKQMKDASG